MSCSSFITELFDPDHWLVKFFYPAFNEAHRWPSFGFIRLAQHPLYCIPWFSLLYAFVGCKILSFHRFILWQARAGYMSGYEGAKKEKSFLQFKVHITHHCLISYIWCYLTLSSYIDKIILGEVFRSFLMRMKYFYPGGISFISWWFLTLGCLYSLSSKRDSRKGTIKQSYIYEV